MGTGHRSPVTIEEDDIVNTMRTAIIFPDTNLFIQCHPLENLDWSSWADHDELHLVICRSVQRELDNIKNGTNDRAVRARRALQMVRTILRGKSDHVLVKKDQPVVKLLLAELGPPSDELREVLDYSKPDDELIGHAHRYSSEHPEAEVFMLTHDTGVMATAMNVELEYREILDDWLIGSQRDSSDPETTRLKARIKDLELQEPRIESNFLNNRYMHHDLIEIEYPVYEPMSQADIDSCMRTIRNSFPMKTDFSSGEPKEPQPTSLLAWTAAPKGAYTPATAEEIRGYQEQEYPRWLRNCESFLSNLHSTLQAQQMCPYFELEASNVGSRPAQDVLVQFIAKGEFQIYVEPIPDTEPPGGQQDAPTELPKSPESPAGRWSGPLGDLGPFANRMAHLGRSISTPLPGQYPILTAPLIPRPHDPNGFYYKPRRPTDPTDSFSLECEQWRHKTDAEIFDGIICFDLDKAQVDGEIVCEIHAANLSAPLRSVVRVRIRTNKISTEPVRRDLLRRLKK